MTIRVLVRHALESSYFMTIRVLVRHALESSYFMTILVQHALETLKHLNGTKQTLWGNYYLITRLE